MDLQNNNSGIPVSVSLEDNITAEGFNIQSATDKKRLLFISVLAVIIGMVVSFIAKILVLLINTITNLSFYHRLSALPASPASNHYGVFVIIIPVIGGVIVGLMALYGSRAIRGHGIPEAMEQILTNKSRIRPSITYLKPLSSAVSIGTGGPFGAEGPIIATGGALGSTLGQLLKISHYERKILLAAGATAGMSAIFGSPIAAIFLAIELLLFEFSPSSILPVALACITGSAGHHLFFEPGYIFSMPFIASPGNTALAAYSLIGALTGLFSAFVTKLVYSLEDFFEKLPVHWMWWPAIGGLAVGITGYFFPRTMGVGYENITGILSAKPAISLVLSLCFMKLISWSIALSSGTSGGTLAPLLTIGAAAGLLLGNIALYLFPGSGIFLPLAALVGMSAMFAGASRALLTSIVFAMETTGQANALLPLLAACIASYFISFLLMRNTIMTEKIARRGIRTPHAYEPDVLDKILVKEIVRENGIVLSQDNSIEEVRNWLKTRQQEHRNYYIVTSNEGVFKGIINSLDLFSTNQPPHATIGSLVKGKPLAITNGNTLKSAVKLMAAENVDVLPVITMPGNKITGILSYRDILASYKHITEEHRKNITISLKRRALKILVHGKQKIKI